MSSQSPNIQRKGFCVQYTGYQCYSLWVPSHRTFRERVFVYSTLVISATHHEFPVTEHSEKGFLCTVQWLSVLLTMSSQSPNIQRKGFCVQYTGYQCYSPWVPSHRTFRERVFVYSTLVISATHHEFPVTEHSEKGFLCTVHWLSVLLTKHSEKGFLCTVHWLSALPTMSSQSPNIQRKGFCVQYTGYQCYSPLWVPSHWTFRERVFVYSTLVISATHHEFPVTEHSEKGFLCTVHWLSVLLTMSSQSPNIQRKGFCVQYTGYQCYSPWVPSHRTLRERVFVYSTLVISDTHHEFPVTEH